MIFTNRQYLYIHDARLAYYSMNIKALTILSISTTNRLFLISITMNADNRDASEVPSPSFSDSLQFVSGAKGQKSHAQWICVLHKP